MIFAPIALFVYNRVDHVTLTIDSLKRNLLADQSDLFIFSDAAKSPGDSVSVLAVRNYIRTLSGFKSINIIERADNYGLARSIIEGVTSIVDMRGIVIVLEDDMVTSPYFLTYMNDALEKYKNDKRVISIHGYMYPVKAVLPDAFFLRGADCWGWATWSEAWKDFNPNGADLLKQLQAQKLEYAFDLDGSYPYTSMLKDQIKGRNSSWAIRWYASAFLKKKLTLYPGKSLVTNIGNDSSGTHCADTQTYLSQLNLNSVNIEGIPIEENVSARKVIADFLNTTQPPMLNLLIHKFNRLLRGLGK